MVLCCGFSVACPGSLAFRFGYRIHSALMCFCSGFRYSFKPFLERVVVYGGSRSFRYFLLDLLML